MVSANDALVAVVIVLAVVLGVVIIAAIAFLWLRKKAPPPPAERDTEYGLIDQKFGELTKAATVKEAQLDHGGTSIKPPKIENLAAYKRLEELLLQDPTAASFIADAIAARAMDEVAQSFVVLFEAHSKGISLIKYFIDVEMTKAHSSEEGPGTLFRMDSMASKIMRFYCKLVGHQYLTSVLWPQIRAVLLSDEFIELDDAKMKEGDSLIENLCNFQDVIANFLEAIINSSSSCPQQLRLICQHLSSKAMELFPYSHLKVVGGFIFLRFFTPAVMSPITHGIIEGELTANQSRTLVLVAKVLQNLANGLLFGEKEQYMMPMNEFLSANFPLVQSFLADLATKHPKEPIHPVPISQEARLVALRVIHFNIMRYAARLKRNNNVALHEQILVILKELDDYAASPPAIPSAQEVSPSQSPVTPSPPSERSRKNSIPSRHSELPFHKDLKTTSTRSGHTNIEQTTRNLPPLTATLPLANAFPPVTPPPKKVKKTKPVKEAYLPNPRLYRPKSNPRSADLPQSTPDHSISQSPNIGSSRYSSPSKSSPQLQPPQQSQQAMSPQYRFVSPAKLKPATPRSPSPKKQPPPAPRSPSPKKPATTTQPTVNTTTKKKQKATKARSGSKSPTKRKKAKAAPATTTTTSKTVNANTLSLHDNNGEDDDNNDLNIFHFGESSLNARTPSLLSLDLSISSVDDSVK